MALKQYVFLRTPTRRVTSPANDAYRFTRQLPEFIARRVPEDALREMRERITTRVRYNAVVETGVPGFVPRRE